MKFFIPGLCALTFIASPVFAHEGMLHDGCAAGQTFTTGDITVSGAFTRATLPKAPVGGGYMTISNAGATVDRLLSVATEATPTVELHDMKIVDGMMEMNDFPDGIEVPAGGSVSLAPGGMHVMFINPKAPFKEGECVAVTLSFATAGTLEVQLIVGPVGAEAPPDHAGHTM